MKRLTMTSKNGGVAFTFDLDITCEKSEAEKILKLAKRLKEYEDTNIEPSQLAEIDRLYQAKCEEVATLKKEIAEYRQKLVDGRLVELPCKAGDIIFLVDFDERVIDESEVISIDIATGNSINTTSDYLERMDSSAFGIYAFKSRGEAEQALSESGGSDVQL